MGEINIVHIDLKMSAKDFNNELQDQASNWNEHMDVDVRPASTRQGKSMYKVVVDNGNGSTVELVGDSTTNSDIYFHDIALRNMGNSFYRASYTDNSIKDTDADPLAFLTSALSSIVRNHNGDLGVINSDESITCIRAGKHRSDAVLGIVDKDGTVYCRHAAKDVTTDEEEEQFHVKVPINQWLMEHMDVQQAISQLGTIEEKMDYIGKWLIAARNADEIEASEFMDIFRQAGLFGFSDPNVKRIYKLFM